MRAISQVKQKTRHNPNLSIERHPIEALQMGNKKYSLLDEGPGGTRITIFQRQKDGYYIFVEDRDGTQHLWMFFNNTTPIVAYYF